MDAERGDDRLRPDHGTLNTAASSGNLELVQWLVNADRGGDRVRPDHTTLNDAAGSGNLELVEWLRQYMAEEAQQPAAANAF